jgi:preprotein translocase subunit SecG
MEHGTTLIAILHIVVAVLLVTIVLLQDSKNSGVGGAFGGGGSSTLFGATGAANFLVKVTRGLAIIFMGTCIGLTLLLTHRTSHSVVDNLPKSTTTQPIGGTDTVPAQAPAQQAPAVPAGK